MGLQSAMEALPEALLPEQRASFMEDLSEQHLWAYLLQPFYPMWQFLRLQVQWSHDNTPFFVKEIRNGSVSPTRPSATPTACTWIGHAYVDRTLFSGARVGWAHFIAERDLSSQDRAGAKENTIYPPKLFLFRKKEWESEIERECVWGLQWLEKVVAHASVGDASSRSETCFHNLLYRAGAKEPENAIYSPQVFLLRKKDVERASMTGESSRKNLNILQASASKLSGFTPRIQPSACGLGLYNARCKTR